MKITRNHLALAFLVSTLNSSLSTAHAQGPLTPPGAPAPLFKTLSQLEPRTPTSGAHGVTRPTHFPQTTKHNK